MTSPSLNKRLLIVCGCSKRGSSIGVIGSVITSFKAIGITNIDLFDTSFYEMHRASDYDVVNYISLPQSSYLLFIRRIPYIRSIVAKWLTLRCYRRILSHFKYDLIIIHQIPAFCEQLIDIVKHESAVMIRPWGSEVLRASSSFQSVLMRVFAKTDYVLGYPGSTLLAHIIDNYGVPPQKIVDYEAPIRGISLITSLMGKMSREQMSSQIGIRNSSFNVVCGYSAARSHRHELIINSFACIHDTLPQDYQLIFLVTYGGSVEYINHLKYLCSLKGLNATFIESFISDEQLAFLHLITDLYINIQPSDNGSAFLIESLVAGNRIVCGSWLKYSSFEKYGIPYFQINCTDELPGFLDLFIRGLLPDVVIPQKLIQVLSGYSIAELKMNWATLFHSLK